ncbi:hypothetical protein FHW88_002495 [Mucilaginibacter sp. SG538B]|uniref:hypothetical protein n=1 Tax=Mucilaginibacter sp. SG538B TaxID=2587021 RepID=UPI00159D7BE9|nr:hypothetical protein [Mucilaginibacter sp. SG538B]NVM64167.1 hypothetical protein [Mucilaginibacter sp. SG538B]NVM64206.1 hypothetical protein [Mucilaginibacter sp. SG538B]
MGTTNEILKNEDRSIPVTLSHEFWCCKQQLHQFGSSASLLLMANNNKEMRLAAFTAYGNFIRHLYAFYEGVIKYRNADQLEGAKGAAIGPKISNLLFKEVKKLIRNKRMVYNARPELDKREIQHLIESEVPADFGKDFRQMRNRFSHPAISRVNKSQITLQEFYVRYHKYMLLLYYTCAFSWDIKNPDVYDWQEIDCFFNYVNKTSCTAI